MTQVLISKLPRTIIVTTCRNEKEKQFYNLTQKNCKIIVKTYKSNFYQNLSHIKGTTNLIHKKNILIPWKIIKNSIIQKNLKCQTAHTNGWFRINSDSLYRCWLRYFSLIELFWSVINTLNHIFGFIPKSNIHVVKLCIYDPAHLAQ